MMIISTIFSLNFVTLIPAILVSIWLYKDTRQSRYYLYVAQCYLLTMDIILIFVVAIAIVVLGAGAKSAMDDANSNPYSNSYIS